MIYRDTLPPGLIVERPKAGGFVMHEGVTLPGNHVLHNTPERGEHISSLRTFAQGQPIRVRAPAAGHQPAQTVARAYRIAQRPQSYSVAARNCQHTARDALGLIPESPQAQAWLGLGALALVAWGMSRAA